MVRCELTKIKRDKIKNKSITIINILKQTKIKPLPNGKE